MALAVNYDQSSAVGLAVDRDWGLNSSYCYLSPCHFLRQGCQRLEYSAYSVEDLLDLVNRYPKTGCVEGNADWQDLLT